MGVKFLLWNTERRLKKIAKKTRKNKIKARKGLTIQFFCYYIYIV